MRYERVKDNHGKDEFGKDIVFRQNSDLGSLYYAVVAKTGPISGASSGKKNLAAVQDQVETAFSISFLDTVERRPVRIDRVLVWTTGTISPHAKKRIVEQDEKYRNVQFFERDDTIELLENHYPSFFTIRDPLLSEYYSGAKDFFGRLEDLRTLGSSSDRVQLPVVFIEPTLLPFEGTKWAEEIDLNEALAKFNEMVENRLPYNRFLNGDADICIIGEAGAGKTTLLRQTLLQIIEQNESACQRTPIPVYAEFRNIDFEKENPIEDALVESICRFSPIENMPTVLKEELKLGNVIVFLDGLDEIRDITRINAALEQVQLFRTMYPNTRVIFSSRIITIFENPDDFADLLQGFEIYSVAELSRHQMQEFIDKWYGKDDPIGHQLVRFLDDPDALRGLPATPLTLALVAILYEGGQREIPANLTELFEKYTELALGRWDVTRGVDQQFEWKVKQFLLRKISWKLHDSRVDSVEADAFFKLISEESDKRGFEINPTLFSDEVTSRSELLYENSEGSYEFKHRTFRDYFVGMEINGSRNPKQLIVDNATDPWWTDAIFFAFGLQPDNSDYLMTISKVLSELPRGERFAPAVNLGRLAQASYLTSREVKSSIIKQIIDMMIDEWDYASRLLAEQGQLNSEIEVPTNLQFTSFTKIPSHFLFLSMFVLSCQEALGSFTLQKLFSEIADEYIADWSDDMSDRSRAIQVWRLFLLSVVCGKAGDIRTLEKIVNTNYIKDPSFLYILYGVISNLSTQTWLDDQQVTMVITVEKVVKKRLGRKTHTLPVINEVGPLLLPDAEE